MPGGYFVLSLLREASLYDWNSVHFGHPTKAHFHTAWLASNYIRVFRSNPGPDSDDDEGGGRWLDVQFGVETSVRDKVQQAIERDLEELHRSGRLADAGSQPEV